jgi:hypothetical protein
MTWCRAGQWAGISYGRNLARTDLGCSAPAVVSEAEAAAVSMPASARHTQLKIGAGVLRHR